MTRRGIVGGFVIGVFKGGFIGWLTLPIMLFGARTPDMGETLEFIMLMSIPALLAGIVYCSFIIICFFPLPMIARALGKQYPEFDFVLCIAIASVSSVAIWTGMLSMAYHELPRSVSNLTLSAAEFAAMLPALAGGFVAGHTFWKHAFPGSTRS